MRALALTVALALIAEHPARSAARLTSLESVRAYATRWQHELASVVAEEVYEQQTIEWPRGREVRNPPRRDGARTLVSDVLLVRAPRSASWLMFRDVLQVDGQVVRDRASRFDALFARPDADLVTSARRIADESARYNLGRLVRNINTPATALIFLDETMAESTTWKRPRPTRVDGRAIWELEFEQDRAPFAIRTPDGRPLRAKGRFLLDSSGRILGTDVRVNSTSLPGMGQRGAIWSETSVDAWFGPVAGIDAWVPLRMSERIHSRGAFEERVRGDARYTRHRLFRTSARIVGDQR